LAVSDLSVNSFRIQLGALDYGVAMDGIIGTDFLLQAGAQIDFKTRTIK